MSLDIVLEEVWVKELELVDLLSLCLVDKSD
jgi:hypothetical protein